MLQYVAKLVETYPVRKKICNDKAYNLSVPITRSWGPFNFDGVIITITLASKFNISFEKSLLGDSKQDD